MPVTSSTTSRPPEARRDSLSLIAGAAHTLAVAMSTSALNVGIAAGSALGGMVLSSSLGLAAPTLLGAGTAVAAVLVLTVLALRAPSAKAAS